MGKVTAPGSVKFCATCGLWGGPRGANGLRNLAEYDTTSKGECLGGGFNRLMVPAISHCNQWIKWSALK